MKHNEAHEVEGSALFLEWTAALRNHLNTQFASYQEGKENERLARVKNPLHARSTHSTYRADKASYPIDASKYARHRTLVGLLRCHHMTVMTFY